MSCKDHTRGAICDEGERAEKEARRNRKHLRKCLQPAKIFVHVSTLGHVNTMGVNGKVPQRKQLVTKKMEHAPCLK